MVEIPRGSEIENQSVLQINFIRHGAKDNLGNLTMEGRGEAASYGQGLKSQGGRIKIYTSEIERAIDTGRIISEFGGLSAKQRISSLLSEEPWTDEQINGLHLEGGRWLFQGEETRSMAGKIALFIQAQRNGFDRMKTPGQIRIFAISHVPPLMCFMGQVLSEEQKKNHIDQGIADTLFSFYGGSLVEPKFTPPLEGFEVRISRNTQGEEIIIACFPDGEHISQTSVLNNWSECCFKYFRSR
jgi:broad specificity phosphatase PhoE